MNSISFFLSDEAATVALGGLLAQALQAGDVVYLRGDLGAGKTTLTRGVLNARGHQGACKSPTYTLVEPYSLATPVYHFDLYRIQSAEELDYLALDEYFRPDALCLIEWPEKGAPLLPPAVLELELQRDGASRRAVIKAATTERGQALLDFLSKSIL